jgi:hypothetical protein
MDVSWNVDGDSLVNLNGVEYSCVLSGVVGWQNDLIAADREWLPNRQLVNGPSRLILWQTHPDIEMEARVHHEFATHER